MSERLKDQNIHSLEGNQETIPAKTAKVGASWALDFAKGFGIDALAVGSAAIGPWVIPESTSSFINENIALTVGGTYALYMFTRYLSMRADIKLQEMTGITTNAWGKTAQTIAEWAMPKKFKSKDYTSYFQAGGELLKFIRDEAIFLVPTIAYGVVTDKVWESVFFLNVGTIAGYGIRVGLQENPLTQRFLKRFIAGDSK